MICVQILVYKALSAALSYNRKQRCAETIFLLSPILQLYPWPHLKITSKVWVETLWMEAWFPKPVIPHLALELGRWHVRCKLQPSLPSISRMTLLGGRSGVRCLETHGSDRKGSMTQPAETQVADQPDHSGLETFQSRSPLRWDTFAEDTQCQVSEIPVEWAGHNFWKAKLYEDCFYFLNNFRGSLWHLLQQ